MKCFTFTLIFVQHEQIAFKYFYSYHRLPYFFVGSYLFFSRFFFILWFYKHSAFSARFYFTCFTAFVFLPKLLSDYSKILFQKKIYLLFFNPHYCLSHYSQHPRADYSAPSPTYLAKPKQW